MTSRQDRSARPALLVFLLLASVSGALLARAWLTPPRGTAFAGTFAYLDDFYNYLSLAEQAQRGAILFRSKLASPELPATLVNLEWLIVGWLAAVSGGHLALAYRLLGLVALAAGVWSASHWLSGCGVPADRRLPALLLVFTGGGIGGLGFALGLLPGERAFDLRLGAFPFVEALANPHFMVGTALLATALGAFAAGRPGRGAALGALLGLVRPYDAALLGAAEAASLMVLLSPRHWLRRATPLLLLLPSLGYYPWVLRANPGIGAFASPRYGETTLGATDWLLLLGPAAVLALAGLRTGFEEPRPHPDGHLTRLRVWAAVSFLIALLRPVAFSSQFLVGIGFPLLLLAAARLAPRRHALEVAVPLMATSAVVYVGLCLTPSPRTHPPVERLRVAEALRASCRPGERVLAPDDIGLYVGGLTPCWPYVSHPAAPDHESRLATVHRFYDPASTPAERSALLASSCITHVVLPAGPASGWLGDEAYRPRLQVDGPNLGLAVWSREPSSRSRCR